MISDLLPILDLFVGILLSFLTLVFLIRLIMTWYPKITGENGFWIIVTLPTNQILNITKKIIPPIGGVDVSPIIWIGIISLTREILVGQQGLIKLAIQNLH